MITIKNYVRAQSLEEAYTLNQTRTNCILGGMLWLKLGKGNVNTAIDLSDLGLNQIEETGSEFTIGAMVSLRQLEKHPGLNAYTQGAMAAAVRDIVGVQFRNSATVGGSIYGRFGFSDVLTMFLSMDTSVELYKGGILPLEEFVKMKYDRDLLVRLIVKKSPGQFSYQAVRIAKTDFPVLTCAVSCMEQTYRVAVGARPGRAVLLRDEEGILKTADTESGNSDAGIVEYRIPEEAVDQFANWAAAKVPTGSNVRGSAEYRTHLVSVLVKRGLLEIGGRSCGN